MSEREEAEERVRNEIIEEAMAPFEWMFTGEGREVLREILECALATHPVAVELIEQIVPRGAVQQSGTVSKQEAAERGDSDEKVS